MKPSQISDTATFIAIKFYGLTREPRFRALFDDKVIRFYEQLVGFLPFPYKLYERLLDYRSLRCFFKFWEELLLPGDLMHVLMRKWYLQQMTEQLKKEGFSQLIILGAGFDHLATLQSRAGMTTIEFDANRMASIKQDFVSSHGYENDHLHIIPYYFSAAGGSDSFLYHRAIDPTRASIIVAEGFFDYLSTKECAVLLQDIRGYFQAPLSMISTIFSLQELSAFRSFVYRKSIRLAGEQLRLQMNKSQFNNFLKANGFLIERTVSYRHMEKEILEPHQIHRPVLSGFYVLKSRCINQ